ncbi:MAG: hypothetical protein ACXW5U_07225 [Thermoanaerobaculia bacterium]
MIGGIAGQGRRDGGGPGESTTSQWTALAADARASCPRACSDSRAASLPQVVIAAKARGSHPAPHDEDERIIDSRVLPRYDPTGNSGRASFHDLARQPITIPNSNPATFGVTGQRVDETNEARAVVVVVVVVDDSAE